MDEEINYRKINNYNLEKNYEHIINYKQNGIIPPNVNQDRFIEKFTDFKVRNGRLYYDNLEVIKKEDIDKVLQPIYDNPSVGLTKGISKFYDLIVDKFLNVTRQDVQDFLRRQTTYQLTFRKQVKKQPVQKFNKENVAYALDLIDISRYATHNRNFKFILTMVDVYSQKVFIRPLKNKEANSIYNVLRPIFQQQAPKMILMDNGGEFKNVNLNLYEEFSIKVKYTPSHTPQPNIEQVNSTIRKMISKIFVQYANEYNRRIFNWIDFIKDIENNINNYNSLKRNVIKREKKAIKRIQKDKPVIKNKFNIGDKVRIAMSVFEPYVRQQNKAGLQKYQHVKYSINVFTIYKIYRPANKINTLPFYILKTMDGEIIFNDNGRGHKRLKENDLLKVPDNTEGIEIEHDKIEQLNGIER